MEEGKAQSGWGGARPPRRYRAVVSAELYEEMGAGVLLVVGGEGPEVLKGPRELRGVMWLVCPGLHLVQLIWLVSALSGAPKPRRSLQLRAWG